MLLCFSGKARVGKDTAADYMINSRGWTRKVGFADNLKNICMEVFELSEYEVRTQDGKSSVLREPRVVSKEHLSQVLRCMNRTHVVNLEDKDYSLMLGMELYTPRDVLQFIGTEVIRLYVPNYHLEAVINSIVPSEKVVITDARFPNEINSVLDCGGYVVRINRPYKFKAAKEISKVSSHPSETALDDYTEWSYIINNDGDCLDSLYEKIDSMLSQLEKG